MDIKLIEKKRYELTEKALNDLIKWLNIRMGGNKDSPDIFEPKQELPSNFDNKKIIIGDIRKLGGNINIHPFYLVLEYDKKLKNYIIAPFSFLNFPIFDGEIKVSGLEHIAVLQTWLATKISEEYIKESLFISRLKDILEFFNAKACFMHYKWYIKKQIPFEQFKFAHKTGVKPMLWDFVIYLYIKDQLRIWVPILRDMECELLIGKNIFRFDDFMEKFFRKEDWG